LLPHIRFISDYEEFQTIQNIRQRGLMQFTGFFLE
jgi:hypothetical protein